MSAPLNLTAINTRLANRPAEEILRWAVERFHPNLAFASSFGAEDVVVIDLLARIQPGLRIFTLDTGRLHEQTYEVMEQIRRKYGVAIEVVFPDHARVEALERGKGFYSFRESLENRKECCAVRKMEPISRAIKGLDAWITGLRREQAVTRGALTPIEADAANPGLYKVNPLVDWTQEEVWAHIRANAKVG